MKNEEICQLTNTCEKLSERSCIYCGKDSKRYHKPFAKASKNVFTTDSPESR